MKKLLLLIGSIALAVSGNARVLTVSNATALPGSPGQYTTLAAAVSASLIGDTILIQPSLTKYAESIFVDKQLTFIGAGYNPQTFSGLKAAGFNFTFSNGSSNSAVIGLAEVAVTFNNSFVVNNYLFAKNELSGTFYSNLAAVNGVVIENCILSTIFIYNQSAVLQNNIIKGLVYSNAAGAHTLRNNLFLCSGANIVAFHNSIIENNIFYSNFPGNDLADNTFNNNFVFGSELLPFGNNIGSGNKSSLVAIYPNFICSQTFTYTIDFRPLVSSICYKGGTDGTDIGPTGGLRPIYKSPAPYPLTGEPLLPQVQSIKIPVASVKAGSTINVTVKARK